MVANRDEDAVGVCELRLAFVDLPSAERVDVYLPRLRHVRHDSGDPAKPLEPGETEVATLDLAPRDFSYWDVAAADWRVADGCYGVLLGASSRDIRQQSTLVVGSGPCAGV